MVLGESSVLLQVKQAAAAAENGGSHIKEEPHITEEPVNGAAGAGQMKEEEGGDRKRRRNRWGAPATAAVKPEPAGKHAPQSSCLGSDLPLTLLITLD